MDLTSKFAIMHALSLFYVTVLAFEVGLKLIRS